MIRGAWTSGRLLQHLGSEPKAMALSIEEKYDEVRQLITLGKEKGYLLYEEVNDMLPSEISSSDELDDIFSMFGSMGIEVVDSEQKYREKAEGEEGAELDLTPRHPRQDQRPCAHVPARDGNGAAAHARGRGRDREAHRARQEGGAEGHRPHPHGRAGGRAPGGAPLGGRDQRPRRRRVQRGRDDRGEARDQGQGDAAPDRGRGPGPQGRTSPTGSASWRSASAPRAT